MLTEHLLIKKIIALLIVMFSVIPFVSPVFAQVKIGSNPTIIGTDLNLEIESINGNKTVVQKNNGNMGIGTSTPGNKLEIKSDEANQSGLRFTNMNNASPPTEGSVYLGVNGAGDVVITNGAIAKQFLSVARTTSYQGVSTGQDIIPDGVIRTNNTIPYDNGTGIATLTVGKTYSITSNLHCAQYNNTYGTFGSIQFAVVNAATNQPLDISAIAELFGHYNPGTASSGSVQMIFTPSVGFNKIKLRALQIIAGDGASPGQVSIRNDLFSGITITEL